jgi:hypothetical protein
VATVPVSGKVTLDGQPLGGVMITYHPDAAKGNKADLGVNAQSGDDGSYTLQTFTRANTPVSGAPVGAYVVTVAPGMPAMSTGTPDPKNPPPVPKMAAVPQKYLDQKSSPLHVEVVASAEAGRYDLKLTKK